MQVNVHEAKTRLSELLAVAEAGEEVVIARNGAPAARLVAIKTKQPPFPFGELAGQIEIGPDFDDPLPDFAPYS